MRAHTPALRLCAAASIRGLDGRCFMSHRNRLKTKLGVQRQSKYEHTGAYDQSSLIVAMANSNDFATRSR